MDQREEGADTNGDGNGPRPDRAPGVVQETAEEELLAVGLHRDQRDAGEQKERVGESTGPQADILAVKAMISGSIASCRSAKAPAIRQNRPLLKVPPSVSHSPRGRT